MPDPDEYVRIRGDQLREKDGRSSVRVTNELEEVLYLDKLQLLAVTHPRGSLSIRTRAWWRRRATSSCGPCATSGPPRGLSIRTGSDARAKIAHLTAPIWRGSAWHRLRGYADDHALTLDLGGLPADRTLLLAHRLDRLRVLERQRGGQPGGPRSEAARPPGADAPGEWQTVIEERRHPRGPASDDRGRSRRPVARRRSPRPHRDEHADLLGPGPGGGARHTLAHRRLARARSAPISRSAASRPQVPPTGASPAPTTTRGLRGRRPGRCCRAATRAWATYASCCLERTTCSWSRSPGRRGRCPSTPGAAATAPGLDAHLPAPRRTASARRWTSTRRARTSCSPLPFHGMTRYPYARRTSACRVTAERRRGPRLQHAGGGAADPAHRAGRGGRQGLTWTRSATPPPPARPTCPTRATAPSMRANADRMLGDDRLAPWRVRAVLRRTPRGLPRVRPRRADLRDRGGAARQAGRPDPQRAHRPLPREGEGARRLHPDRHVPGGGPEVARRTSSTRPA